MYLQGIEVQAILLDGEVRERNKEIQLERTKGYFLWPDFQDIEEYRIPTYIVRDHNGLHAETILRALEPDVIINAGTPRRIGENILAIPKRGMVNVHPGMLPSYQGSMTPEWAILNDDPVVITCHFATKFYDDGPIVLEKELVIKKGDIWQKVRAQVIYETARVMAEGLRKIEAQNLSLATMPPLAGEGTLHKRMPDDKLHIVKAKLADGTYKHAK